MLAERLGREERERACRADEELARRLQASVIIIIIIIIYEL